jgi:all-trans-retinol 13,14-reductase
MFQVFLGFAPWIIYWIFSGSKLWSLAILGGLFVATILVTWRWLKQRDVKAMEAVTLGYFLIHAIVTLGFNLLFFKNYAPILSNLTLASMAWGTLITRSPFTYQYARESWPREMWKSPIFLATNQIITAVWGVIFLVNAGLGALSLSLPNIGILLNAVIANILVAGGIAFSLLFPKWFPRIAMQQKINSREPYKWPAPKFDGRPSADNEHDVIVVGSGIGGLTAAALLAKRGLKVAVFEQHFKAGGYCTSWELGVRRGNEHLKYVFDAGVHDVSGLGERGAIRNVMKRLDIEEEVDWHRMDHEYFLNGIHLRVPRDPESLIVKLGELFPYECQAVAPFFSEMKSVYHEMFADVEKTGGVPLPAPRTVEEMLAYPSAHPHLMKWMDRPFGEMLSAYFKDERLKQFLSALTGYRSDDPTVLTVGAMAPIFGYYFDGGYYPGGGSQKLADSLVSVITKHGGRIYLRTPVKRIVIEHGCAVGVELPDEQIQRAKVILSNADLKRTFFELVGSQHLPKKFGEMIKDAKSATSAFMVFLGVDFIPDIESMGKLDEIGVMNPSKVDPTLAPQGHAAMTLIKLIPQDEAASWDRKAKGYCQRKHTYADAMVAEAEKVIPNLGKHIIYRQEASPRTFERYTWATAGSIYGATWDSHRPPLKSPVPNLYLVGAGVFPGPGVEAVVISGTLAADEIFSKQ